MGHALEDLNENQVLALEGLTHGGSANRSAEVRVGLSVQHLAGWLVQTEFLMVDCPPEEIVDWPDDLIRFLGYQRRGAEARSNTSQPKARSAPYTSCLGRQYV